MRWKAKTEKKSLTEELAEAISGFNIAKVAELLSENGQFAIQTSNYEVITAGKDGFLSWLGQCMDEALSDRKLQKKLRYAIVKSMHSILDSSIVLFDDGRFPVLSESRIENQKSGIVVKTEGGKVNGIRLCILIMKTESPFIYERRLLGEPDR